MTPQKHILEALERVTEIDHLRQRADREPTTDDEKWANEVLVLLCQGKL